MSNTLGNATQTVGNELQSSKIVLEILFVGKNDVENARQIYGTRLLVTGSRYRAHSSRPLVTASRYRIRLLRPARGVLGFQKWGRGKS